MSIEYITEKIVSDAKAYAEKVIAEAEAEAKAIMSEYEALANEKYNEIIDGAYEKSKEIFNRSNAHGLKEKRVKLLTAKWEYMDKAFAAGVEMLRTMPDEEQLRFLSGLLAKYQREDAELIFNKADCERIGKTLVDTVNSDPKSLKVVLAEETGDFSGGFIIKEGRIETDFTYDTIVSRMKESLEEDVFAILFEHEAN